MINKSISEIKNSFNAGKMNKIDFAHAMNNKFNILNDFQLNINDNLFEEISITQKGVIVTLNILNSKVKFFINEDDIRETPKEIFNFNSYEYNETFFLNKFASNSEIIFDIGSNIGWFSVLFNEIKSVKKIYAFEPLLLNFKNLIRNLKLNNSSKVDAFNIGLSSKNESLEMHYNKSLTGATSIMNNLETKSDKFKCEFETMDFFVRTNNIKQIDLIKIDVEGAELLVLKGGIEAINEFKPILFVELLRKWCKNFNYHPNEVIEILNKIGYLCFEVTDKLNLISSITDKTIATNFFFLHKQKHSELMKF